MKLFIEASHEQETTLPWPHHQRPASRYVEDDFEFEPDRDHRDGRILARWQGLGAYEWLRQLIERGWQIRQIRVVKP